MKWMICWKGYLMVRNIDGSRKYYAQIKQGTFGSHHFSKRYFRKASDAIAYAFRWMGRLNYEGLD
jgi:hypothetical protein